MNKQNKIKYIVWLLANTFWFGFFMFMIIEKDYSFWIIAIPIIFHWTLKDLEID